MNEISTKNPNELPESIIINNLTINSNAYYSDNELELNFLIDYCTVITLMKKGAFKGFKLGNHYYIAGDSIINEMQRRLQENAHPKK